MRAGSDFFIRGFRRWQFALFLIVGTGVLDCVGYLLFSGKEKRSKKVTCDYYRGCVPSPETLFYGVRYAVVKPSPSGVVAAQPTERVYL